MHMILMKALRALLTKILLSAFSQAFLEWTFFKVAELLVKCTKNTIDDEALAKFKEEYFKK